MEVRRSALSRKNCLNRRPRTSRVSEAVAVSALLSTKPTAATVGCTHNSGKRHLRLGRDERSGGAVEDAGHRIGIEVEQLGQDGRRQWFVELGQRVQDAIRVR